MKSATRVPPAAKAASSPFSARSRWSLAACRLPLAACCPPPLAYRFPPPLADRTAARRPLPAVVGVSCFYSRKPNYCYNHILFVFTNPNSV
jgi:hypothetical protein